MTTPSHNPSLREQLDAVRPDSEDLRDDDLQEAARAVAGTSEWRDVLTRQQSFDRTVAAAMQDVAVPDGLQSRLLESLAAADSTTPADVSSTTEPPTQVSRRSGLKWLTTAAGLLLAVALGWLVFAPDGSQITLDDARHKLLPIGAEHRIDISGLKPFDKSFVFALPDAQWQRLTSPEGPLKGVDSNRDGTHDGAVYEFQAGRRGRSIHGYLLVLPTSRLADPPVAALMSTTGMDYQPVANTAWIDPAGGLVYICFVDRGDLEELQRLLRPHTA